MSTAHSPTAQPADDDRPFSDPARIPALYADQNRVARRSGALLDAKVEGRHVGTVIADIAATTTANAADNMIADIGCGWGGTTRVLHRRLPSAQFLAVDASFPMLHAARTRLSAQLGADASRITFLQADFHQLPLMDRTCMLAVAAFCVYHSRTPSAVITEIARCLALGGTAILVTKSADSYHELDELLAATGLDPDAACRPSLYATAHGTVLPILTAATLSVVEVTSEQHVFRFRDALHLAEYLMTVPKYQLAPPLQDAPAALAVELRRRHGDGPVVTTSTITYVTACRGPRT
ncbi:MAG: class I SAM-dependent methyltransferase [Pseudonocardiaceae bacterium]